MARASESCRFLLHTSKVQRPGSGIRFTKTIRQTQPGPAELRGSFFTSPTHRRFVTASPAAPRLHRVEGICKPLCPLSAILHPARIPSSRAVHTRAHLALMHQSTGIAPHPPTPTANLTANMAVRCMKWTVFGSPALTPPSRSPSAATPPSKLRPNPPARRSHVLWRRVSAPQQHRGPGTRRKVWWDLALHEVPSA